MKRGKDEEKSVGPMFPRLHVNDADKGGPRGPPRNKMALYEQLSIPSQSFNPGLNPNNNTNLVPLASSTSQGSVHERGMFFPLHLPFSNHPADGTHTHYSDPNNPMVLPEQKEILDQRDFTVPIFVHSGTSRHHPGNNSIMDMEAISPLHSACPGHLTRFMNAGDKEPNSASSPGPNLIHQSRSKGRENSKEIMAGGEPLYKSLPNPSVRKKVDGPLKQTSAFSNWEHKDHTESICTPLKNADANLRDFRAASQFIRTRSVYHNSIMDMEGISPLHSACPGHLTRFMNAGDKEPNSASSPGPNLIHQSRSKGRENSKEIMAGGEPLYKSLPNPSVRKKVDGPLKQTSAFSNWEPKDHTESICTPLKNADANLRDFRAASQYIRTRSDCVSDEPLRGIENGKLSILRGDMCPVEQRSLDYPSKGSENREDSACGSLQTGNVDGGDDVSETSMVDCISNLDISPDDVVGVIGQKQFWKARRAIVNQQRMFAVQVFELHRLIKVQKLMAGSPHLLLEDNAYLGSTFKNFPSKKLPLDYIVKPPSHVVKDDPKKQNKMEFSAENAIRRASLSSVQDNTQPSVYRPLSGNQPPKPATINPKTGPWSCHQPLGNQWLVPVVSPSEGLIYKPYPGPAFMGPYCGGCGPPGSAPITGDSYNPAYRVPTPHQYFPGTRFPSVGHGYFPSYGMPGKNPTISDSPVEDMNRITRPPSLGHCGQSSEGGANYIMQHESSCNVPNQMYGGISDVMKLHAFKERDLRGSTASRPIERLEESGACQTTAGKSVLPLFPTFPDVNLPDEASQRHNTDQSTGVFRVVPRNARCATDSVARIFQRIQEEKRT